RADHHTAPAEADRQDGHGGRDRSGGDEDRDVLGLPRLPLPGERDRPGDDHPGRRGDEDRQQHGRVPGDLPDSTVVSLELGVAIAAVAVSAIALVATLAAWRKVRALRRDQQAILGGSTADVVDFAVSLQGRIDDLHRAVDEVAAGLTRVDRRVDGAVTNTSVVRYDAYEDAGGQHCAAVALIARH